MDAERSSGLLGGERFPHPFLDEAWGYTEDAPDIFQPKTLLELIMAQISWTIRQKDSWWTKIQDENIRKTWIQEIRQQEEEEGKPIYHRVSDNMFAYLFGELADHAEMRGNGNGLQLGPYDRIWFADDLVSEDLTERLVKAVKPLEDVPDDEKDWHPGSNEQVLDLVHPSICPLVYGSTFGKPDPDNEQVQEFPVPPLDRTLGSAFQSRRFQWLPSDFSVSEEGKVKLVSPYINNIHPAQQAEFASIIESVLQTTARPLWERVLSDLCSKVPHPFTQRIRCVWSRWQDEERAKTGKYPGEWPYPEDDDVTTADWHLEHPEWMSWPDCPPKYDGRLKEFFSSQDKVNLRGHTIQVIVKLANIVLTPEKPEYPGGKWHVEGMNNERVVSTFIYYYDSENIEDATLSFRQSTCEPEYHGQDDSACMQVLYGMKRDCTLLQDVGGIKTKKGRCVAFPNLYQHHVSPFKLIDKTKPGYRKILVFFLIDPTEKVPSATDVPARQLDVLRYHLRGHGPSSRLSNLPVELLDYIAFLTPGVMDRKEAEDIRAELIGERSVAREAHTSSGAFFAGEFNMCEH